jgi:hypothetical protein
MRYHWGLGVGHVYAHPSQPASTSVEENSQPPEYEPEIVTENDFSTQTKVPGEDSDVYTSDSDNPELSLGLRDFEGWESDDQGDEDI